LQPSLRGKGPAPSACLDESGGYILQLLCLPRSVPRC